MHSAHGYRSSPPVRAAQRGGRRGHRGRVRALLTAAFAHRGAQARATARRRPLLPDGLATRVLHCPARHAARAASRWSAGSAQSLKGVPLLRFLSGQF